MKKITCLLTVVLFNVLLSAVCLADNNNETIYTIPSLYPNYTTNTYAQPNDIANAKIREKQLEISALTPEEQKAYHLGLIFSGAVDLKNFPSLSDRSWTDNTIREDGFTLTYDASSINPQCFAVGKRLAKDGSTDYVVAFSNIPNDVIGILSQLTGAAITCGYFGNDSFNVHGVVNGYAKLYAKSSGFNKLISSIKGKNNDHVYFTGYGFGGGIALLVGIYSVEHLGLTKEQVTIVPIADPAIGEGCVREPGPSGTSVVKPAPISTMFVDHYRDYVTVYRATRQSDILMKLLDSSPLTLRHFGNVIVDLPDPVTDGDIRDAHTFKMYTDFINRCTSNYHGAMKTIAHTAHK